VTNATHYILIIEDEPAIRAILRALLNREGFKLIEADTGARAQIEARTHKPDLLLVDLGLPDTDGLTVIRHVRGWSSVPIIVLSARNREVEKITALDVGADDYITKPFSAPELVARVRACLRRNVRGAQPPAFLSLGTVWIDLTRRQAGGVAGSIHLTPLEYRVLECLARQGGMVVRARQIVLEVWGPGREQDTRGLRVYINSLREKLEPDVRRPRYLVTEAGIGYRLLSDEIPPSGA
jgi:two-component system, OmpR family, KDP operon response regulator KdpE